MKVILALVFKAFKKVFYLGKIESDTFPKKRLREKRLGILKIFFRPSEK